jgi:hypothetical protein
MKKLILLPILLVLSGCLGTGKDGNPGVEPIKIPALPTELAQKAERLPDLTNNTMGGRELDGAETDAKYNAVALQLNSIITIYQCVEKSINNKENPNDCLK